MSDPLVTAGDLLASALALTECYPKDHAIHEHAQDAAHAARRIIEIIPFDMALAGQVGPPARERPKLVVLQGGPLAPIDDPAFDV